jgi:hypothetical protein
MDSGPLLAGTVSTAATRDLGQSLLSQRLNGLR